MSDAVFPTLPGEEWKVRRTPRWNTRIQKSASSRELRATNQVAPLIEFSLGYEVLREAPEFEEIQQLTGFFNARRGRFDSFLYEDAVDHVVVDQPFGTGDGVTVSFQLVRTLGGNTEPVMNLNGVPVIEVDGVETVPSSITAGRVVFASPPADGVPLTWSGDYYYRCRFLHDEAEFERFLPLLWNLKKFDFIGSLGNRI